MSPRWTHSLRISTPQAPTVDPDTGLEITPPPMVATVPGRVSLRPVGDTSRQAELLAEQNTTISLWTLLVPKSTELTSASEVVDITNPLAERTFVVVGQPARRPDHRPVFVAASVRLISDMQ